MTILTQGWVNPDYAYLATQHEFILTIFQKEWLKKVHVKSDTGMGRNGIKTKIEMQEFISVLKDIPFINMTGIYTHFALAVHEDKSFFNKQLKKWDEMYAIIKKLFI